MSDELTCPICTMTDIVDGDEHHECVTCGHEWDRSIGPDEALSIRDANGTLLADGDSVTIIKDLKTDGKAGGVKVGTKVKSIRLVSGDHEIDARVNGRQLLIKAMFVKKA